MHACAHLLPQGNPRFGARLGYTMKFYLKIKKNRSNSLIKSQE